MAYPVMLILGITFGFIASVMAFLITYNEYQKHQFAKKRLWKESLSAAFFTFTFFLILSIILGYLFTNNLWSRNFNLHVFPTTVSALWA